jgi:hypothetical protein
MSPRKKNKCLNEKAYHFDNLIDSFTPFKDCVPAELTAMKLETFVEVINITNCAKLGIYQRTGFLLFDASVDHWTICLSEEKNGTIDRPTRIFWRFLTLMFAAAGGITGFVVNFVVYIGPSKIVFHATSALVWSMLNPYSYI